MPLTEHVPHTIQLPPGTRAGGAAQRHALPLVRLARDSDETAPHTLKDTALETLRVLQSSTARLYRRDTIIIYPDPTGRPLMQPMSPQLFRTWVLDHLHYFTLAYDKATNQLVRKIKNTLSTSEAEAILLSNAFWPALPEIRRTHPMPMPVLRPAGQLETLPLGYDSQTQIYTFQA